MLLKTKIIIIMWEALSKGGFENFQKITNFLEYSNSQK